MRILITGVTGFVGRHLAAHALSEGAEVYGLARSRSPVVPGVRMLFGDLLRPVSVRAAVLKAKPARIFHLAGIAWLPLCEEQLKKTFATNVEGTRHVLEAALSLGTRPKVLVSGSAEEYGRSSKRRKLRENSPMHPEIVYSRSKMLQELLGFYYFSQRRLPVVRARAFNHIGPGQSERYSASGFAKQAAAIALGRQEPEIRVGNLKAVRDYTDVRDVVRAYWLLLEKGKPGEAYNVASGKGRRVEEILRFYLDNASVTIKATVDPTRLRRPDLPYFIGDASKLRRATGWKPRIGFERTLSDIFEDWKEKLGN